VKLAALLILMAAGACAARAETITITLTGNTGEIQVGEGPIFGRRSYQRIPAGDPFALTYVFDEARGTQSIAEVSDGLITQSGIENTAQDSPGRSATLQIGSAVWEFGTSVRSQVMLKTVTEKSEKIVFATQSRGNHISTEITPAPGGYWPKNGDWRANLIATSLAGSTTTFSADNGSVSAEGKLIPATITVTGVDLDGQWLQSTATAGGPESHPGNAVWQRQWRLAHASPLGGYIVEEVTQSVHGTSADGSAIRPIPNHSWLAWQVAAGATAPSPSLDSFSRDALTGSGEEIVTAVARFYEGLTLPASFVEALSPYAEGLWTSATNPELPTRNATLPVVVSSTIPF
jgi:hypothetical protein